MVRLYLAKADQIDDKTAQALLPLLPAERRQANGIIAQRSLQLQIAAGALLLYAQKAYGLPADAELARTEYGKPYFPEYPGFCFSLSHSGSWALCAVDKYALGADIQQVVAVERRTRERCLTNAELNWLDGLPDEKKDAAFCRIWCLKESLLKAEGCGLRHLPSCVQVIDEQGRISERNYDFHEFSRPGHAAAVCFAKESIYEGTQEVDLRCLLRDEV